MIICLPMLLYLYYIGAPLIPQMLTTPLAPTLIITGYGSPKERQVISPFSRATRIFSSFPESNSQIAMRPFVDPVAINENFSEKTIAVISESLCPPVITLKLTRNLESESYCVCDVFIFFVSITLSKTVSSDSSSSYMRIVES